MTFFSSIHEYLILILSIYIKYEISNYGFVYQVNKKKYIYVYDPGTGNNEKKERERKNISVMCE